LFGYTRIHINSGPVWMSMYSHQSTCVEVDWSEN